jgi:TonB family protein
LSIRGIVVGLIIWLALQSPVFLHANQDPISTVRELYVSADYEGALAAIGRLGDAAAHNEEFADYRILCLLALDRTDDARQAIASLVEANPFHHLLDGQAPPKLRTRFEETRRALLPGLVQRLYDDAKSSYDKADPSATRKFERLIAVLDDPDLEDARLSDLRAVASGFINLSKAASANVKVTEPAHPSRVEGVSVGAAPAHANDEGRKPETTHVSPTEPAPPTTFTQVTKVEKPNTALTGPPDLIRITSRGAVPVITPKEPPPAGLEPPLAISQSIPQWTAKRSGELHSVLEVSINEQGNVTTVALQQPMQPAFDQALLKAAGSWKYKPALLNGTPVPFVKLIEIQILSER